MKKFIEVLDFESGAPLLVRVDEIRVVRNVDDGCADVILKDDRTYAVCDSYETVKEMLLRDDI